MKISTPMKPRLFIAGPSLIRWRVAQHIAAARAAGWHITYDWTSSESWDRDLSCEIARIEAFRIEAQRNLLGVAEADAVLWVVSDKHPSSGAPYEAGYARALGKPTAVLWENYVDGTRCIYPCMNGACYWRLEDALETLELMVRDGRCELAAASSQGGV